MLGKIAAFEFRYQIRNPVFFVTFVLFALIAFGNVTSDNVNLAATGNVNIDSPDAITQVHLTLSVISLLIVTAFLANIVLRDTELRTDGILYSTRITKGDYLFGRFIGAFAVSFLVFSATTFGTLFGTWMPWVDPERLGGFNAAYYVYGLFVIGLPNLLFTGAIAFAVATLTRSLMLTYAAMVAMIVLFGIAGTMLGEPEFRNIASMMDPFGGTAYGEVTRYWTAFERNERLVPLEGLFLYNRLLWSGIALLLVGATYWIFRFDTETRKSRKLRKQKEALQSTAEPVEINQAMPVVAPVFNTMTMWRQLWLRVRFEVWSVVRSVPFLVLVVLSIVMATGSFISLDQILGTSVWPVTRVMTNIMSGTFTLAIIIIVVYYGAEIVWQEHQLGFNEILDATPTPNWVFAGSKLIAILLVMVVLLAVGVVVSMLVQFFSGYTNFEFG
ncbi:MAG: ABC transporter permease, partial [Gammaproteobacteria bacterium]